MPKRPYDNEEERIRKKIRRYEKKLARVAQIEHVYSSESVPRDQIENGGIVPCQENSDPQEHHPHENYEALNQGMWLPEQEEYSQDAVELQAPEHLDDDVLPGSSLSKEAVEPAPAEAAENQVDPLLIEALGDCHSDTPEWGQDILEDISQRWQPILKMGLKKETKEDLNKKYLFPKNVPSSKPPVLNPEISAVLTEASRSRDAKITAKQNQIGRVITAIGQAMTGLINKTMETSDIIRTLNDAGRLLSDSHFLETDTRRALITPLLDKSYVTAFKDRKRDQFLFGENLGDFIKSSRGIKKTGQLITPPPAPSSNLNYKGPLRQQQRNTRTQQLSRGGGTQRAPPPAPRRSAPPPPPPAYASRGARRPPAHPGPSSRHAPQSRSRNVT